MGRRRWIVAAALIGAAALGSPALAAGDDALARMLRGESAMTGKKLDRAIEHAAEFPLGDRRNPVRVTMPQGQRLYLARLRCSDGQTPSFYRAGNAGFGPFGNIIDIYIVTCADGTPARSEIYMDMYHAGFMETRPVPGFTTGPADRAPPPASPPAPPPPTQPAQVGVPDPTG